MDYGPGKCCEPLEFTPFISSGTVVLENVLTDFKTVHIVQRWGYWQLIRGI